MKFFERTSLIIFSIIICIISAIIILMTLDLVSINLFTTIIAYLIAKRVSLRITIIVCVILLFISLKFIIFGVKKEELSRDGIILENSNGKLIISKDSLENMVSSSTKAINGIEYVNSKTLIDKEHKLLVYVTIVVPEKIIVKDVTKQLQDNIKQTMKNTADLEVSSVVITVKNIVSKKVKEEKNLVKKEESIEKE